ncbi:Hypothetical protein D9617_1g080330 [Elsinoe fawcettii]|nr:Hypothetical protein D9617_1g080330 [Elsinoe fawcettii]
MAMLNDDDASPAAVEFLSRPPPAPVADGLNPYVAPIISYDSHLRVWGSASIGDVSLGSAGSQPARLRNTDGIAVEALSPDLLDDIYQEAQLQRLRLEKSIRAFVSDSRDDVRRDFDVSHVTDFNIILEMIEKAKSRHISGTESGNFNKIRRALRSFSRRAAAANSFMKLLPSQSEYGSVLCGGIGLILKAAEKLSDFRDDVADVIEQLPAVFGNTNEITSIYYHNADIHRSAAAIWVALAQLLEQVLGWFRQSPGKKFFKAALKQQTYGQDFRALIEKLQSRQQEFQETAQRNHMRDTRSTRLEVHHLRRELSQQSLRNEAGLATIQHDQAQLCAKLEVFAKAQVMLESRICDLVAESHRKDNIIQAQQQKPVGELTAAKIYQCFELDPNIVREIPQNIRHIENLLDSTDQACAAHLIEHEKLQNWLFSRYSTALLVNGRGQHSIVSPVTAACVTIVRTLAAQLRPEDNRIIPLYYFCGEGLTPRASPSSCPEHMLRVLTCQMLAQHPSLEYYQLDKPWKAMEKDNVTDLARFFVLIIRYLQPGTRVMIFIDGISHYEDRSRREATFAAAEELLGLVRLDREVVVKIMMTSPSTCNTVWRLFEKSERLELEQSTARDSGMGWTAARNWLGRDYQFRDGREHYQAASNQSYGTFGQEDEYSDE